VRERLVVGNWKMNPPTVAKAVELAAAVAGLDHAGVTVAVAPPTIAIPAVAFALQESDLGVYAQDVHWEDKGAFTGQLAATMLDGLARGAIVGHSEVRRDQCDDDERVGRKLARAAARGLRVILCVGESAEEFEARLGIAVIARQVRMALATGHGRGLRDGQAWLAVAYEPVWAIGTGRPATADHAAAGARAIRAELARFDGLDADAIPVLYGGSVSAKSVGEFAKAEGIDGALVGGASLDPEEFGAIVRAFA
jgi:triosephosphate isomerase